MVLPLHTAFPAHTRRCGGTWSYGHSWLHARRLRLRLKLLSRRCRPTSMDMGAGLSCRTWPSSLTCLHMFSRDCRALLSALDRMAPNLFSPTEITSRCLTGEPLGSQCSAVPGKHPHLPSPALLLPLCLRCLLLVSRPRAAPIADCHIAARQGSRSSWR